MSGILDYLVSIFAPKVATVVQPKEVTSIQSTDPGDSSSDSEPKSCDLDDSCAHMLEGVDVDAIHKQVFPYTPIANIQTNLPIVLEALEARDLLDKQMICYALSTINVECAVFKPISEGISKYNTDKQPFDKYIGKLGNKDLTAAALYRGAGYIQLTGFANYSEYDKKLDLGGGLIDGGYEAANETHIAAAIFAAFIKDRETGIRSALKVRDFRKARTFVNGNAALNWQGLQSAYEKLEKIIS